MKSHPTSDRMVRRLAVSVAASAGLLALAASPAAAQTCYPPGSAACQAQPTLAVSVTVTRRGGVIQVTVTNFQSGTTITITIQSVEQTIGTLVTDAQGSGTTSVTAPATLELGAHTLSAKGLDLNGNPVVLTAPITVVADGTTGNVLGSGGSTGSTSTGSSSRGSTSNGSLAKTGAVVLPTAAAGFALVAGGVVLRRKAKTRKTAAV